MGQSVAAIYEKLEKMEKLEAENEWAQRTLKAMRSVSPTALCVVFRALSAGREMDLRQCLAMELRVVTEFMRATHSNDFFEGVRALLVDKDKTPKWKPKTLSEVGNIDRYFE